MKAFALPGWSRDRAWIWYLAVTCLLTALYSLCAGARGQRPADQLPRPLRGRRDRRRNPDAQARRRAAWWLFAAGQFLFFSGDLYTYSYPKLLGADVGVPVDRRRALPPRLPGADGRPVHPHQTAKPAARSDRTDRRADPDDRHRPPLVGLPDRAEHPSRPASRCWRTQSRSPIRSATSCCSLRRSGSLSTPASARRRSGCSSAASSA